MMMWTAVVLSSKLETVIFCSFVAVAALFIQVRIIIDLLRDYRTRARKPIPRLPTLLSSFGAVLFLAAVQLMALYFVVDSGASEDIPSWLGALLRISILSSVLLILLGVLWQL